MSAASDLQEGIAALLEGALPDGQMVIRRVEKDLENDLKTGNALQKGAGILVMMPVPASAVPNVKFVFIDKYECRVRLVEVPMLNRSGRNIWETMEAVMTALHWTNPLADRTEAAVLAHPLMLDARPVEVVEGEVSAPGFEHDGKFIRIIDVRFRAVVQVKQAASN
jgi:hypothetical protein